MTILVVRNGVFAADSQVTCGGINYAKAHKIRRLADGSLLGASGDTIVCARFLDWVQALITEGDEIKHEDMKRFPYITGLWVRPEGVFILEGNHKTGGIAKVEGEFFAEGSGYIAALAAMHAGASARRAVEITCKLDRSCELPVQSKRFNFVPGCG